jgi:hypothetical protein
MKTANVRSSRLHKVKRHLRFLGLWVPCFIFFEHAAFSADVFTEAKGFMSWDSNVSRAQLTGDIVSDRSHGLFGSIGSRWDVGTGGSILLSADGEGTGHLRYSGLDETKLAIKAQSRYKFGLGGEAPWIGATASIFRSWHPVSLRDQYGADLTVTIGKRWSDRLTTAIAATRDIRHQAEDIPRLAAFDTNVYDGTGTTIFGDLSFALNPRWILNGNLGQREGAVVSTTRRNFAIFSASTAIAPDQTFGPDFFGYRVQGRTTSSNLGLTWLLGESLALQATYGQDSTHANGNLDYDTRSVALNLIYQH